MEDILLLMIGIIGIITCVAVLVAIEFYDKWQSARDMNTELVQSLINQRKAYINNAVKAHCYQCLDYCHCETHFQCEQCQAIRKYMEE